jgi:hypothetical protein
MMLCIYFENHLISNCLETATFQPILNSTFFFFFFSTGFQNSGSVSIGGILQMSYGDYDAAADTYNLRSIGRFSTDAGDVFIDCPRCPLATYQLFVNYYGDFTYADDFVQAAAAGTATDLGKGNADFGIVGFEGRAGALRFCVVLLF